MSSALLVQLSVSKSDSNELHRRLSDIACKFGVCESFYSKVSPLHCTLAYFKDIIDFDEIVKEHYLPFSGKEFDIQIGGFAVDSKCVAFLVEPNLPLQHYPENRPLHLTMLLNGKPPVYSNFLILKLLRKKDEDVAFHETEHFESFAPFTVKGKLEIKYKSPEKTSI